MTSNDTRNTDTVAVEVRARDLRIIENYKQTIARIPLDSTGKPMPKITDAHIIEIALLVLDMAMVGAMSEGPEAVGFLGMPHAMDIATRIATDDPLDDYTPAEWADLLDAAFNVDTFVDIE